MARVPDFFGTGSETNIATYDFIDVMSGTGLVSLYLGKMVSGNRMSNISFYSDTICTSIATNTNDVWTTGLDLDFDFLVNRPLTIQGNALVNVPMGANGAGQNIRCTSKIRKYSGTTETEIANSTSKTVTGGSGTWNFDMTATGITVPLTNFKKGDYLRLTLFVEFKSTQVTTVALAHDPKGRTDALWTSTTVPSIVTFQCPVRIDV